MCSEMVSNSCSTSGTRRISLIIVLIETNDVITYKYVSVVFCLGNHSLMPGSMLILTWVGIIFVIILHRAKARCKILTNIMSIHVKISIEPDIRELFRF